MIRKTTFIVLFLVSNYCFGQFSVSAGFSRLRENLFRNEDAPFFGKNKRHLYNYYTLQADYTKSFFRTYTEFGFLPASFEVIRQTGYSSGGGSSPYHSVNTEYRSKVNFMYFTVKGGVGMEFKKLFKKNWWCSFSFNLFTQYDRLVYEKEPENMNKTTIKNAGKPTEYTTNNFSYDLLAVSPNLFQFGIELKERVGIKNFFIEFSVALSSSIINRTEDANIFVSNSYYQYSSWGLNTGVKLGYYLVRKPKSDK